MTTKDVPEAGSEATAALIELIPDRVPPSASIGLPFGRVQAGVPGTAGGRDRGTAAQW